MVLFVLRIRFFFISGTLNLTVPNLPEPFRGGPSASPFSQQHALAGTLTTQNLSKYTSSPASSQLITTLAATSSSLGNSNGSPPSPQVVTVASVGSHQQGNKNSFGLGTVSACPPTPGLEEQVRNSLRRYQTKVISKENKIGNGRKLEIR